MSALTLVVVAGWVLALFRREPLLAIAIGGMMPSGAFLVLGGIALPTVYASAIFAVLASVLLRIGARSRTAPPSRGILVLWVFALWVVIVTVAAPFLFSGVQVIALGGTSRALDPATFLTSSNIAQLLYLVLGVACAALAAARPERAVWFVYLALAGAALLSVWRYAGINLGLPFPYGFFDNSPGFRYIDGAPGGIVRFRGIFSEPAALAASSLACVATGVSLLRRVTGGKRVFVIVGTLAAAFNLSQSTSATGVLAAAVLVVVVIVTAVGGLVLHGRRWSVGATTLVVIGATAAIWLLPVAGAFLQGVVDAKVGTSSYDERSGADLYSFGLVLQTYGFGVGVGSNRPSSFLAALLAGTGVIGSLLFFGVVMRYSLRATAAPAVRPLLWALLAIMLAKFVASPDLSDTTGTMWLAIGALIGAQPAVVAAVESVGQGRHRGEWVGNTRLVQPSAAEYRD
jgi:hypothetical protein